MRHKIGIICITLGTVLILGALSLLLYNQREAANAEAAVNAVLPQLMEQIHQDQPKPTDATVETTVSEMTEPEAIPMDPPPTEPEQPTEAPVVTQPVSKELDTVELEGHSYIGYISIPSLQLTLPVMADWSYPKLKLAPCCYCGSIYTQDLVLMAHNYDRHFGRLSRLNGGEAVTFTDVHGVTTEFTVVLVDILNPTDVEQMTAGAYDLTLFTCTYGGKTRVTVRCQQNTP